MKKGCLMDERNFWRDASFPEVEDESHVKAVRKFPKASDWIVFSLEIISASPSPSGREASEVISFT